jgi:hypothetical protein
MDADGKIVRSHHPSAIRNLTEDEVVDALLSGLTLRTGSDWYENIRSLAVIEAWAELHPKKTVETELVKCACGHTVPRGQVMSASMGTSCPDCYDEMS